jgi:hypothetical protein
VHQTARESAFVNFTADDFSQITSQTHASQTQKREAARRAALAKSIALEEEVIAIESALGIEQGERWTPASTDYQSALEYLKLREYQCAIDDMEKLIVQ